MDLYNFKLGFTLFACVVFAFLFFYLAWKWYTNKDPDGKTGVFFSVGREVNLKDWETIGWIGGYLVAALCAVGYGTYLYGNS